jgi:Transglycosylase SLT domain
MALDPNIILQAGNFKLPDYGETMQLRELIKRQRVTQGREDADYARQQEMLGVRRKAAEQVGQGNYKGAQQAALDAGDFDLHGQIGKLSADDHAKTIEGFRQAAPIIDALRNIPDDPDHSQRTAFIQSQMPRIEALGVDPDFIGQLDLSDQGIDGLVQSFATIEDSIKAHAKANEPYTLGYGDKRFVGSKMIAQGDEPVKYVTTPAGSTSTQVSGAGMGGNMNPDAVFNALIEQESGGRPGVIGPQTRYGRAQGMTQMLPGTAKEMAAKLGVEYRPDLMTGKTPEAAQYQQTLGRAYFDQALQQAGGDMRKALMYYHGGPDTTIHGAKTRAYADQVLGRVGSAPKTIVGQPKGADVPNSAASRKEAMTFRKEFDNLPEVKNFKTVRNAYKQIETLTSNPKATAQDDMAAIFTFMKTLDPTSTVREGEYASARNATGVPDQIRNLYNRAQSGNQLNPQQRRQMRNTAARVYLPVRDAYNSTAEQYQGYAKDAGIEPLNVARLQPRSNNPAAVPISTRSCASMGSSNNGNRGATHCWYSCGGQGGRCGQRQGFGVCACPDARQAHCCAQRQQSSTRVSGGRQKAAGQCGAFCVENSICRPCRR